MYENMSPEQQEQVRQQANALLRRLALYFVGGVVFWMLFTRRPQRSYAVINGGLVPVNLMFNGPGGAPAISYP